MSGSNKFARGGGGRGLNRMVPPPLARGIVPLRRGLGPGKEKGRADEASMKGRGLALKGSTVGAGSAGGPSQEENFELVSCREHGAPANYAMAIRLTPVLLEALKRGEELGEPTTMKFGDNPSGHVITVGEEEFRFSSAPEPGHLCDIFEEQRRGDDGTGLLVESGAVWRKLSVIRTLSATDKDRMKARSVEAERQQKSRKAIILDHSNSLMNNKAATSGDANGRRAPVTMKPKKEPPQKKRKISASVPVIPPLAAVKTRLVAPVVEKPPFQAITTKGLKMASLPESKPVSSRATASQGAVVPPSKLKGPAVEEVGGSIATKTVTASQKDKVSSPALPAGGESGSVTKATGVVNTTELRNCLITLLMDNPKGMILKAVEKGLGEAMPHVRPDKKQIEKVIKAIASYHAPGKYMLKEGVEKGAFAKPSPGSGSSPETVPVESPPLANSPALLENVPETQPETGGNADSGGDRSVALKRTDVTSRNSSLPLQRGGENAVSRAIRKAGEIVRGERLHPSGPEKARIVVDSPGNKLEESSLKDSTAPQETTELEHAIIGRDESPVTGCLENEHDGMLNGIEVDHIDLDVQNQASPHSHEADNKKENTDGSDSSSDSDSESESGSESESESASGSRTGSGTDTDSDGSSSSASEEENMDEDVDIISDDEDKADVDVVEASKQRLKSKDTRVSLERQETRVQKQAHNKDYMKKQKQKGTDEGMTPHGSEDGDIGDGAGGAEFSKVLEQESIEKGAKGSNSEEEVEVVSSDEDTPSPEVQGIASPADSRKHNDNAPVLHDGLVEEVRDVGDDNLQASLQARSGSESDHSIEEYETRAENSGVRGARVKVIGDQKEDTPERRIEGVESAPSPRSKGSGVTKLVETQDRIERESKTEIGSGATLLKDPHMADSLLVSKDHSVLGGVSFRPDNTQRSLLGTPPIPRDGSNQLGSRTYREATPKSKAMESKKKDVESFGRFRKNNEVGERQEKIAVVHRGPQRFNKLADASNRSAKPSEAYLKPPGDMQTPLKTAGGMSKPSEEPGLMGKGPDTRDISTADLLVKSSGDGAAPDLLDAPDWLQRRQNREGSLLGKPGKASEFTGLMKEYDQSGGLSRDKDVNLPGRSGREAKHLKKPNEKLEGLRRGDFPERAGTAFESGEKPVKDTEIQRRLSRDGESWRKSPKAIESGSRLGNDSEAHTARVKDLQKTDTDHAEARSAILGDMAAAKAKVSRMTSDLELGELRDIVAGEELRTKDFVRNEVAKSRESFDLSSRQPPNRAHTSPEKDKPRNLGKQGLDVKKRSPAPLKKQKVAKKDSQKVDIPISLRDTGRPAFSGPKMGAGHEDRLEIVNNRAVEVTKIRSTFGELKETRIEGRGGKRLAEEGGISDSGRPSKRAAVDVSQVATSLGRGELETTSYKQEKVSSILDFTGKTLAVDMTKDISAEGGNQPTVYSNRAMGENGRVLGPKIKGHDLVDKEVVERRGSVLDFKQKTTTSLLGPGSKRELQGNGKKRSTQTGDMQGREFFALYEKRVAELKGPILQYEQYSEYCKEYNEKYPVYVRLNTVLESDKEDFECFSRDISVAKAAEDKNKLGNIYGKVRKDYLQCRKRFKRMQKTFSLLHDELRVIKQRCKEYAEKVAQG